MCCELHDTMGDNVNECMNVHVSDCVMQYVVMNVG